jgi:hypothetical protein
MCFTSFAIAQNTSGVRTISLDSLKKYNIGIAKTDTSKIHVIKTNETPWSKMTVWQKGNYIIQTVITEYRLKYPITFWLLVALLTFWILKQVARIFKK